MLIWPVLSVPKGYCLDITTIVLCFPFNTKCYKSFKSRVGVKVAFLLALSIYHRTIQSFQDAGSCARMPALRYFMSVFISIEHILQVPSLNRVPH